MLSNVIPISVIRMFLTSAIINKSGTSFSSVRDSVTVTNYVDNLALNLTVFGQFRESAVSATTSEEPL